jgi:protein TonB
MFTENVWDPWGSPSRRGWTMLISFTVQAFGVALLLLVPLIYIGALPKIDFVDHIFLPLPPASAHPSTAPRTTAKPSSNFVNGVVLAPRSIPLRVSMVDDQGLTPPQTDLGIGVPFGTGAPNSTNPVINSIGDTSQPFVPRPPAPGVHPPRVSAIMEGYLIHKVEPVYPPLARAARIQGAVELQAVIGKDGHIERLQVLRGHPMLVKAAVDAVQQWRYRPYILNGEPVEVETHVTVNFSLLGAST